MKYKKLITIIIPSSIVIVICLYALYSKLTTTILTFETIEMTEVKGSDYLMGALSFDTSALNDEKPRHKVHIDSFYMSTYEITQKQYEQIIGENPSDFKYGEDYPVERVSWYDAIRFCNLLSQKCGRIPYYTINSKIIDPKRAIPGSNEPDVLINSASDGFRLPTEAEWEYACRANTETIFYWGNEPDGDYAWLYDNYSNQVLMHPVGEKKPNRFGLYDMCGNVWEWCYDRYDEKQYASSILSNPAGTDKGDSRVVRGGFISLKNRSSSRSKMIPGIKTVNIGFRIAYSKKNDSKL
jgi:formylglycine-generating enzyme